MTTEDAFAMYGDLLRQVKLRIDTARENLAGTPTVFGIESAALHLRMCLELIVLSSLLTHRREIESVTGALHAQGYNEARKLARSANADYWPVPTRRVAGPAGITTWEDITEQYLHEEDWGREWGACSDARHARNPYLGALTTDLEAKRERFERLRCLIVALTNHHHIRLMDGRLLAAQMHARPADAETTARYDVQVVAFERLDQAQRSTSRTD